MMNASMGIVCASPSETWTGLARRELVAKEDAGAEYAFVADGGDLGDVPVPHHLDERVCAAAREVTSRIGSSLFIEHLLRLHRDTACSWRAMRAYSSGGTLE